MIVLDPELAPLIRQAFEQYATGEYTLRQLLTELSSKGLLCRPRGDAPETQLSLSRFAKLLRSTYYVGMVTYKGVEYQGRHEPLN